jgi:hypothetical protein
MGIRSGEHIKLRGSVYHYRRVVPADCRKAYGAVEKTLSLGTRSKSEAKRLEKEIDVEFDAEVAAIRAARHPRAVAGTITTDIRMPVLGSERGGFGQTGRLFKAELTDHEHAFAEEIIDSYRVSLEAQRSELVQMVRQLDQIFAKPIDPAIVSRYCRSALSLARSMADSAAVPVTPDPGSHTLAWAWERWKIQGKTGEHTAGSEKQAERHWNAFLAHSDLVFLGDVRRHHLVEWRDTLIGTGELAENSINQRLQLVAAILNTGWREAELLAPNLKKMKLQTGDSDRKAWRRDEILKALSVLRPKSWQAWLFMIGLTTSVRLGEPVGAMVEWWTPKQGFIEIPTRATKKRKFHAIPILEFLREPFDKYVKGSAADGYIFDCPRPSDPAEPISNFASRTLNRFLHDKKIERVFHELRDTWINEARHNNDVNRDIWEIISGHSAATVSDMYGGVKPDVLMAANEKICRFVTEDAEMRAEVLRLVT